MARKMKVFEVKNLINEQYQGNIDSKDIQNFLEKSMGIKKTHSSNLEDHEVKAVKEHFVPSAKKTSETPAAKKARSANQTPEVSGQRPQATKPQGERPKVPSQRGTQGQRPNVPGQRGTQGIRPEQADTTKSQGQKPEGSKQKSQSQRPITQTYHAGGSRPEGTSRPDGSGQGQSKPQETRPNQTGQRGQQGMRQDASGQSRPQGDRQYEQGQTRPEGQGNQSRPQGDRQYEQGQARTDGQRRPDGAGQNRQSGTQGMRQDGQGQAPRGPRPQGQSRPYDSQAQRSGRSAQGGNQGYQGQNRNDRPGQRPAQYRQDGANRPDGSGQTRTDGYGQGRQGSYTRSDGYGQGRPQGQQGRGYQGDRSTRPSDQQGTRQGSYQDNRRPYDPQRNRSDGQQQGTRSDGTRPYSSNQGRPSGNRPGTYTGPRGEGSSQRPYSNQGNYQRPQGGQGSGQQRGGYNTRGFEPFNKDEDDKPAYASRSGKRGSQSQRGSERKDFDQKILDQKVAEKNDNRRNRDRMNKDKQYKDKNISQRDEVENLVPKKGQFIKPKPVVVPKEDIKTITLPEALTIKELADKMKIPGAVLIKKLFLAGQVVTINQEITFEEAEEIALEYDIISEREIVVNEVEELLKEEDEDPKLLTKRPPVVCVMGHVDHGKTSLLDAIRHANVTSREAGGITQHIGAYIAEIKGEKITFLDTPGHEAFTSMRMRGAKATDIAILVVAADDGVMPQTVEAISHAKAAGVKIIVAINKIDKPSANVERVKQELTEYELIAEDWGGDTIFVPVSAHTKEGIEQLLEMILLTAEIEELKANPDRTARGLVIEAELDKGRGPVATILVQKGTLHVGDNIAIGSSYGKVRAMIDDKGRRLEEAGPSTPVEILGLNNVPDVGEIFMATDSEKEARIISEAFITQGKEKLIADTKAKLSLDGLFSQIQAGNIKDLNLIIKADVQGSVEAMKQSLLKLSNDEVAVRVIHGGVGAINESDVILASTSNAIIIGFNVKPDNRAKEIAEHESVDIKLYRVIYNAINDIEAAMKGLLDPIYEEKITGHAEVRQIFKASGLGTIAGAYVLDGKITRGNKLRIYRGSELIHEGNLASLKRFQDDVKEVAAGYECGLVFDKFNDVKEEDKVEFYVMVEVPR